jgi:hypothetical protein
MKVGSFVLLCEWCFLPELGPPTPMGLAGFFLSGYETIGAAAGFFREGKEVEILVGLGCACCSAKGPD